MYKVLLSQMTVSGGVEDRGKAILVQDWIGPEGAVRLRLPAFKTFSTLMWQGYQPYTPAAFTPGKYSWCAFLLEAESSPGP